MTDVLICKFQQNEELRNLLLGTDNSEIIYADETDGFWGDGPDRQGQNELGKALVRVREYLRSNQ